MCVFLKITPRRLHECPEGDDSLFTIHTFGECDAEKSLEVHRSRVQRVVNCPAAGRWQESTHPASSASWQRAQVKKCLRSTRCESRPCSNIKIETGFFSAERAYLVIYAPTNLFRIKSRAFSRKLKRGSVCYASEVNLTVRPVPPLSHPALLIWEHGRWVPLLDVSGNEIEDESKIYNPWIGEGDWFVGMTTGGNTKRRVRLLSENKIANV